MTQLPLRSRRPLAVSRTRLTLAALALGVLVPRAASAVQSAELYRTQAYFYGRFEARVRFAPGEGVVSSFFLWRDGSSSTTSWNELDFEKINAACRLQTNIWTGKGTQSAEIDTPTFDICSDYHTYAFEWTPSYIAWFIDGTQIRKVTGASVTEYTQNASIGMSMHFNIWPGDSTFGGTFSGTILPVSQYISWAQYSSYTNNAFQVQWREDFTASSIPSGWAVGNWTSPLNHSTHNPANVSFVNGLAVLTMTSDSATGYSGTPPADTSGGTGTGGTTGTGGAVGTGGSGTGGTTTGAAGHVGTGGATGGAGHSGTGGTASTGTGGTSSTGTGGSGTGGSTGTGGVTTGAGGNGAGGVTSGAGGSGTGGRSGSGGELGTGGGSATGEGGSTATGGTQGTGGISGGGDSPNAAGSGCGCRTPGGRPGDAGPLALLLIATCALRRRRPIAKRQPRT